MTIFLSSHLLGEVSEICDKVIFLDHGEIVEQDSINNVMKKMESNVINVKMLSQVSKEIMDKIRTISYIEKTDSKNGDVQIFFDGSSETSSKILKSLMDLGLDITSYTPASVNLEDFYISVMSDEKGVN